MRAEITLQETFITQLSAKRRSQKLKQPCIDERSEELAGTGAMNCTQKIGHNWRCSMNKKYSVEFKLKVVRDYERGEKGSHLIAQENGIHPGMVLRWYKIYKYHGIDGLRSRATSPTYSKEFKDKVKYEILTNVSLTTLSEKYHLSYSTIKRWSIECGMSKSINRIITTEELKALQEKHKNTKDPLIKELLEQLEYAKMENDCLKKLETLVQARKKKEQ